MGLKKEYNLRFSIVKKAIDEFDPMNLLPHAPSDEYDMETTKILAQISNNSTEEEIATVIKNVFSKSFNENFEVTECIPVAKKIHFSMEHMQYENIFPYEEFKTSQTWEVLDKAVQDLTRNSDIEEKTDRSYIVGYLCKTLAASGLLNK